MSKLGETASYVRSKNAGPFWVTVDIFCGSEAAYEQVARSPNLTSPSCPGWRSCWACGPKA